MALRSSFSWVTSPAEARYPGSWRTVEITDARFADFLRCSTVAGMCLINSLFPEELARLPARAGRQDGPYGAAEFAGQVTRCLDLPVCSEEREFHPGVKLPGVNLPRPAWPFKVTAWRNVPRYWLCWRSATRWRARSMDSLA